MLRAVLAPLIAAALLSGCGSKASDGKQPDAASPSTPSVSPSSGADDVNYFTNDESNAINTVARPAQAAATTATSSANERHCNSLVNNYTRWRSCWHDLLDPYVKNLTAISSEFTALQAGAFPADCIAQLMAAQRAFQGFAGQIRGLLAGIDSGRLPAETKAIRAYNKTVTRIESSYASSFTAVTKVCYSPGQLKKLQSAASASANP